VQRHSRETETTLYLGSYEREIHSTTAVGGSPVITKTVHRHTLGGFATYTRTDSAVAGVLPVTKLAVILKDHLGSTDLLYTGLWNGSNWGDPTTLRESFDAFGERRNASTQVAYRSTDTDAFRTGPDTYERGYTGHEQLDDSGLIHMNGRLYDPELGRMLSPDPYVQVPEYSQNFNRYSYVLNNPLNLTDPTGFSWLGKLLGGGLWNWARQNWRTMLVIVVVGVIATLTAGAFIAAAGPLGSVFATATVGTTAGSLTAVGSAAVGGIAGAVSGGLSAALNGGNLGDVLRGAAISSVQGAITGGLLHGLGAAAGEATGAARLGLQVAHKAGHGIVGGAANAAMGGKFSDGFYSAAIAAEAAGYGPFVNTSGAGGVIARTIQASVVGGTVSVIGGGKFVNGAYTAAFQHLLNFELPANADRVKST
jgi:RHS repeat-associated protein